MSAARVGLASLAVAALSGCGTADQPDAANDRSDGTADRALIARIAALPPAQLDIVLFRAIRDAGHPCQGIAASRRLADQAGRPAWSAECDNRGGRFLLVLSPAGLMNVTPGTALRDR